MAYLVSAALLPLLAVAVLPCFVDGKTAACHQRSQLVAFFNNHSWLEAHGARLLTDPSAVADAFTRRDRGFLGELVATSKLSDVCSISNEAYVAAVAIVGPEKASPIRTILGASKNANTASNGDDDGRRIRDASGPMAPLVELVMGSLRHTIDVERRAMIPGAVRRTPMRVVTMLDNIVGLFVSSDIISKDFWMRMLQRQRISVFARSELNNSPLTLHDDVLAVRSKPYEAQGAHKILNGPGKAASACAEHILSAPPTTTSVPCSLHDSSSFSSLFDPVSAIRDMARSILSDFGLYDAHYAAHPFEPSHERSNASTAWYGVVPLCVVEQAALSPTTCVAVQCASTAACDRHHPRVKITVTKELDTVWVGLLGFYFVVTLLQPLIVTSAVVQVLLAGVFGILVVAAVVSYFVISQFSGSRIGRVGVYGAFAVGGVAAVSKGLLLALWQWLAIEVRNSLPAQIGLLLCATLSTVVCYRYLGPNLSWALKIIVVGLRVTVALVNFLNNPELTVVALASFVVVRVAWFLFRFGFWGGMLLTPKPRLGFSLPFGSSDGTPTDAEGLPKAAFTEQVFKKPVAQGLGHGLSTARKMELYEQQGKETTRRELEKLAAHIREDPGKYTPRVMVPNDVVRFAGVGN